MHACVIFLGPSLPAAQARERLPQALLLPPVQCGSVYRAVLEQSPRVIGLVDGYFERVPAVWHKEILWAMAQGIQVVGAASMGALRAVELAPFGMQGCGWIFRAYRDGLLEDDDEVAVLHGPAELGYRPLTEALVNIRVTLQAATAAGIIDPFAHDALIQLGKHLHYRERSYPRLLHSAAAQGLATTRLRDWLTQHAIDQKRLDALELLAQVQCALDRAPLVGYRFTPTSAWAALTARIASEVSS